jgi:hypothetical protein
MIETHNFLTELASLLAKYDTSISASVGDEFAVFMGEDEVLVAKIKTSLLYSDSIERHLKDHPLP